LSDPRIGIIGKRLERVKRIIAVSSGKGGVGKSIIATTLALDLRDKGYMVGLFDLDFTSPSTHVILGVEGLFPEEDKGIIPPLAQDLSYMSITHYSLDRPAPLRGADVSEVIIELLAITRWEELDYLIIDMPPGISDATLDIIRFMDDINFLLVTTPSKVAFQSVRRLIELLRDLEVPLVGVAENMVMEQSRSLRSEIEDIGLNYLGPLPFDPQLEEAIGDVNRIMETNFSEALNGVSTVIAQNLK
jgi:ATP-binding protein involved in chromosome partitioning